MKSIVFFLLTIGLLFGINSCCTKMDCVGADGIRKINFHNFSENDLDTISIISYSQNSNFSVMIDSSVTQAINTGDYFTAYLDSRIDINLDYRIKLPSTGQVFTLTDFETKKEGCNNCFPYRPDGDFYDKLTGYDLDGQMRLDSEISIFN